MITERQGTGLIGEKITAALLLDCKKVIDIGCGPMTHTKNIPNTVWVDLSTKHAPDPRVLMIDAREVPTVFRRMHFDCALMTDVIEHMPKFDGAKILKELETLADKIVLFTPLGEMWVDTKIEPESPHHHRCGWYPYELEAMGYETWVWPKFHNFSGEIFGAFYAWKWMKGSTPTAEEISALSGVL